MYKTRNPAEFSDGQGRVWVLDRALEHLEACAHLNALHCFCTSNNAPLCMGEFWWSATLKMVGRLAR